MPRARSSESLTRSRHDGAEKPAPSTVYWPLRILALGDLHGPRRRAGSQSYAAEMSRAVSAVCGGLAITRDPRPLRELLHDTLDVADGLGVDAARPQRRHRPAAGGHRHLRGDRVLGLAAEEAAGSASSCTSAHRQGEPAKAAPMPSRASCCGRASGPPPAWWPPLSWRA